MLVHGVALNDLARPGELVEGARAYRLDAGPQLQVLRAVVVLDSVAVVDVLPRLEESTEDFLHDVDVFTYTAARGFRVSRKAQQNVPVTVGDSVRSRLFASPDAGTATEDAAPFYARAGDTARRAFVFALSAVRAGVVAVVRPLASAAQTVPRRCGEQNSATRACRRPHYRSRAALVAKCRPATSRCRSTASPRAQFHFGLGQVSDVAGSTDGGPDISLVAAHTRGSRHVHIVAHNEGFYCG